MAVFIHRGKVLIRVESRHELDLRAALDQAALDLADLGLVEEAGGVGVGHVEELARELPRAAELHLALVLDPGVDLMDLARANARQTARRCSEHS